ncbi:MAG: hypothetical protein GYB31_18505 [Bacteroidetes bacterium]|nr:hypothetical protein [Bacteroidota bacterium]
MTKSINYIGLFIFAFYLFSCGINNESILLGNWQAVNIEEEGNALKVDPGVVKFNFKENGNYTFSSTLNYREAGSWNLEGNILYTLDTVNQQSVEKAVQVLHLSTDSLSIKMNRNDNSRIIELKKTQ